MIVKNKKEETILREAGKRLAIILTQVLKEAKSGVRASDLDILACRLINKAGGTPSFKGYFSKEAKNPFPSCLCVSVNDEIVHGIPSKDKILKNGDIVSLDLGMKWGNSLSDTTSDIGQGLYVDMAITIPIGKVDAKAAKLIEVCREALSIAITKTKPGNKTGDIGNAVEKFVGLHGFKVARELVGHSVGKSVHEDPILPNFGEKNTGAMIKSGMVLALEPMIVEGGNKIVLDDNTWTWKTKDNLRSAHFEHTVLVTEKGAEILTKI